MSELRENAEMLRSSKRFLEDRLRDKDREIEELQGMVSDLQVELKEQMDATSKEEANMRLGLDMIVEIANKVKNGVSYF